MDATQEMVALGVCNMAAAFVDSMPVSGALSRGAVNHASGVATTAGGLYTGALVLLALQVLQVAGVTNGLLALQMGCWRYKWVADKAGLFSYVTLT